MSDPISDSPHSPDRFYYNAAPNEDGYGVDGPPDEIYAMPNEEK